MKDTYEIQFMHCLTMATVNVATVNLADWNLAALIRHKSTTGYAMPVADCVQHAEHKVLEGYCCALRS